MQTTARVLLDSSLGISLTRTSNGVEDDGLHEALSDVIEEHYEKALAAALVRVNHHEPPENGPFRLKFEIQVDTHQSSRFVDWCAVAAVSSLYLFLQANVTGGVDKFEKIEESDDMAGLQENGEEVVGRVSQPGYLAFALSIFSHDGLITAAGSDSSEEMAWNWWYARALLIQQRCLSGKSEILRSKMTRAFTQVLDVVRSLLRVSNTAPERIMAASACLEGAIMELAYDDTAAAKILIDEALLDHLGLEVSVAGALGTRTVHQQDPKSQLVLNFRRFVDKIETPTELSTESSLLDKKAFNLDSTSLSNVSLSGSSTFNDILPHPNLLTSKALLSTGLSPLEQAAVLDLAVHKKKTSPRDAIQPWEISAFTDAVLQQDRSEFIIRAVAYLQVARFELSRSRTKERGLEALERLTRALTSGSNVSNDQVNRMRGVFSVWFPLQVTLKKELGEAYVSMGLVGEAMQLFEQLELWDELIICYRLLDQKVAAEQLIRNRLESTPNDAKLWCTLGDLTMDDDFYRHAWEVSGQKSARAQRSLARSAMRSGDYQTAQQHWEKAVAISPLFSGETWFSLGWCCIKTKNAHKALIALTRAAQMNPEDGETWNNLAAVHMHQEHWKEAFSSLTEAVKHNRESWHTWDNYATVAVKVDAWQAAINAVARVVALSHGQRINIEVLAALVGRAETEHLDVAAVGQLLKQVASTAAADSEFWVIYSRYYYRCLGEKDAATECLMKRVRGLQGRRWKEEEEAFVSYASACIDLCKMYLEMKKKRELGSGRMLIRGALKSTEERFGEHDVYKELETLLVDIQEAEKGCL